MDLSIKLKRANKRILKWVEEGGEALSKEERKDTRRR